MDKNFVNFHRHDNYSNIITSDSVAKPIDYINRAIELNQKMVFSTQHGTVCGYWEYYTLCKKHNLKFGFGVEAYFVLSENREDKTNAHIILLAKNIKGFKQINKLISWANKDNFYYKARITIDKLIELCSPNDVVVTTACIGGVWKYENHEEIIDKLYNYFGDNFYLEIQAHNNDKQIALNRKIYSLHKSKGIKMIAGLDSHAVNNEQVKERDYYLEAKEIIYEDESNWYLDYPNYDVLVERFKKQNVFEEEDIAKAIDNTNSFLEFEDIEFDNSIKLPTLYPNKTQEEKNEILKNIIRKELKIRFPSGAPKEYHKAIQEEWKVIEETGFADYFITNYEIVKRGKEYGGRITLSSRGSAPSWYINNLLSFTTIDRLHSPITIYPERFATADRVKAGSMFDIDQNVADITPFIKAQKELLGENNSYFMVAYGKLKAKSAFKMYARANNIPFEISNAIVKDIDEYEKSVKYAEEDDKESILEEDYISEEYWNIYKESKKYQGIIDSISSHPCAFVLYSKDITEEIGTIKLKDEICATIDGLTADKFKFLKTDWLTVTVVDVIYRTFEKANIPVILSKELIEKCKDDSKVWNIYKNGFTIGINQCEKEATRLKVMKYAPKNISELSAFVASIRPSFKSMINIFLNREEFSYNIEDFDKILQTEELPQSFLLYQEQIMKTLEYVGFDIKESYGILKNIAKKVQGVIEPLKDRFITGFCAKGNKIEDAEKVWQIIQDSSSYSFNSSHSLSVAIDSLYGAYLKAYYPLEFYSIMLEIYTEKKNNNKLSLIRQEMKEYGIKEGNLKLGTDNRNILIDKYKNEITLNLSGVKSINQDTANKMYNIGLKGYDNFYNVYYDMLENKVDKEKRETLIKIGYFDELGDRNKILALHDFYNEYYGKKQINKDKIPKEYYDLFKKYSNETEKMLKIQDIDSILREVDVKYLPITTDEIISYEIEYFEYIKYDIPQSYIICKVEYTTSWSVKLTSLTNGKSEFFKCEDKNLKKDDIIRIIKFDKIYNQKKQRNYYYLKEYKKLK